MSQFEKTPYRILAVDDELTILGLYEQILSPHLVRNDGSLTQNGAAKQALMSVPTFEGSR
jgi:hypothetical protein